VARDQTHKALNLARKIVDATEDLMLALETLEGLHAQRTDSGINMNSYDDDFAANDDLAHVDGSDLNKATTIGDDLMTHIESTNYGQSNNPLKEILQQVRP
jgi:hypothetical protein